MLPKTIIYVDGFNLYYRCLKPLGMQWLDIASFFKRLRKDDNIVKIRYFTAHWTGAKEKAHKAYLRALKLSPLIDIILGKYQTQFTDCDVKACGFTGERRFFYEKEKRTDVNIAIHMVKDSLQNECDRLVLISGDSDLVPAVQMVKDLGKKVVVYVPVKETIPYGEQDRYVATELRHTASMSSDLPIKTLDRAQYPEQIPTEQGFIQKDKNW